MLSERINILFRVLACNNTDIARYASCSSGNISKLKTGNREPLPSSRTIISFANGVYEYADYENMLSTLKELCGSPDITRESIVPALIVWLYGSDEVVLPAYISEPRSKRDLALSRRQFGSRFDSAVSLLGLSNSSIADILNVDVSLISRYRSGIYSPHKNEHLAEKLSELLVFRAEKIGKTKELAELCGTDEARFDADTVWTWLYDFSPERDSAKASALLHSLDTMLQSLDIDDTVDDIPKLQKAKIYYGLEGRKNAIVRFLNDAAREGGELFIYSDEPSDGVLGDGNFFKLWTSLMANCVNRGVKIKIIHNLDRENNKTIMAINRWVPLYVSGMIEPYRFRLKRDVRFYHTLFLHAGKACIHGFFPSNSNDRWYEYITDSKRLEILQNEFDSILSATVPIMKVYSSKKNDDLTAFFDMKQKAKMFLLTELPVFTMPAELLERIVSRTGIEEPLKSSLLKVYGAQRQQFRALLQSSAVNMILCFPEDESGRSRKVNFALDLIDHQVTYTQDEFEEHVAAVIDLVKNEKNFHLTLLPRQPVRETQVALTDDAASAIYCREPYTALVFYDLEMRNSLFSCLSEIIDIYSDERQTIIEKLQRSASHG